MDSAKRTALAFFGGCPCFLQIKKGRARGSLPECTKCRDFSAIAIFRRMFQKNPRVRKIRVRNSGAGNGVRQFYGRAEKCVLSAGKTMSIKFLVSGGGGILGFWGGGECRFYFYGRADFSECYKIAAIF